MGCREVRQPERERGLGPTGPCIFPSLLPNVGGVKTIRVPRKGLRDKGTSERLWESGAATGQVREWVCSETAQGDLGGAC